MGDGELQEGLVWEAAMFAAQQKLERVIAIVDRNGLQIDGRTSEVVDVDPIAEKFRAFGWETIDCDGHDVARAAHGARRRVAAARQARPSSWPTR